VCASKGCDSAGVNLPLIIAAVSGQDIVQTLIWIVCVGIVVWLLIWLIDYCGLPQPFNKIAKIILAVASVIFLINLVMGLAGQPLIHWSR
jgi:glucan phosphoethanolaminetransferase (alkaline phosphatase superfamily)